MAVVAPIASASVRIVAKVKPGDLPSRRSVCPSCVIALLSALAHSSLLAAQGRKRIDSTRTPSRQSHGRNSSRSEQDWDANESHDVMRLDAEQDCREQLREKERDNESRYDAYRDQRDALAEHHV